MIENDEQLRLTFEQLGRMYEALAAMRKDILPLNAKKYAVFSEGVIDQIRELQAEIDVYLGLHESGSQPKAEPAEAALRETPPPYTETQ